MKIINELEKLGLELSDDQKSAITKKFSEEVITLNEHEKKIGKLEDERDNFKAKAESAEETLKGFDGKDLDAITKERDAWKEKAEKAESDYNEKLAEREKSDLLKEAFADIKFTSESAKKAIINQIASDITVKNGKLIGFNELLEDAKKSDASAFVDEKAENVKANSAKFTVPQKNDGTGKPITKQDIISIKDSVERQRLMKENIELFQ